MRLLIAILALGLLSAPALADTGKTAGLSGYWRNEKTGERLELSRTGDQEGLATFSDFGGPATLTTIGDDGLRLYYSPHWWSTATECTYTTTLTDKSMTWTVTKGEGCPSGTFVRTEPPSDKKVAGKPVKSVEQMVGAWTEKREGDRIVIRKGFESYELWHSRLGQGGISQVADRDPSVMRASFDGGRQMAGDLSCTFQARRSGEELIIEPIGGLCSLTGTYTKH